MRFQYRKEAIAQVAAVSSRSEKVGEYISEAMEKLAKMGSSPLKSLVEWKPSLKWLKACSLTVVTSHNTWSLIMKKWWQILKIHTF